jgi:2'-5' RNA ligase
MRVFIGIKPDDKVRETIHSALKPFRKISTPIKWVKPENIHLTLKFIGETAPDLTARLTERLMKTRFQSPPITLNITGFGKFGLGRDLNVFWAGIEPNPDLSRLFEQMEIALAEAGIPRETRPFKPHITLGRNKKRTELTSILNLIEQNRETAVSRFSTRSFQIFKSILTPEGPVYSILKEVEFSHA